MPPFSSFTGNSSFIEIQRTFASILEKRELSIQSIASLRVQFTRVTYYIRVYSIQNLQTTGAEIFCSMHLLFFSIAEMHFFTKTTPISVIVSAGNDSEK